MSDVIKVGDTVTHITFTSWGQGRVIAQHKQYSVVVWDDGRGDEPCSSLTTSLVKVPPKPTPMHTAQVYIGSSCLYMGWSDWPGAKLAGRLTVWSDGSVTFERAVIESDGTITWEATQ